MGKKRRRVRLRADESWTEATIARTMAYQLFNGRSVLVVPNCRWTGHEADLLVIEPGLRVIDVEIKISRADLRADAKKDKWWKLRPWSRRHRTYDERRTIKREWPEKVWKHYYVLPAEIWDDGLLEAIPGPSGVLLLDRDAARGYRVRRQAKPNREAKPISPADAIDIARLASLRMWAAISR